VELSELYRSLARFFLSTMSNLLFLVVLLAFLSMAVAERANHRLGNIRNGPRTHARSRRHDASLPSTLNPNVEEFAAYLKDYNKVYSSTELPLRLSTFSDSLAFIATHNARAAAGLESFTVGINQFADWTDAEYQAYLTASSKNRPALLSSLSDKWEAAPVRALSDLPAEMDWRTEGLVTAVKDQGQCGSCWTFSATGSMEGAWAVKYGRKAIVTLSEQEYVDCLQAGQGCGGGWPRWVFQYVIDNGANTEGQYPYQGIDGPKCLYNRSSATVHLKSYVNLTKGDEGALTTAAATMPGVSVCIDASQPSFRLYATGVYKEKACLQDEDHLDHAVLVVGYGHDEASGMDYYLVKNSWGPKWGDNGYLKMFRDTTGNSNNCGIATVAAYAIAM